MLEDSLHSLQTVRDVDPKSIVRRLLDIRDRYVEPNSKSIKFIRKLKCFDLLESGRKRKLRGDNDIEPATPIKTLRPVFINAEARRDKYVAVSWSWDPSEGEDGEDGGYCIQRDSKPVKVRNVVLDRITRLLQYRAEHFNEHLSFWIDSLSINQGDPPQKEEGMQAMNLVYRYCKYALGYLWVELETQEQVNLLARLLQGKIVGEPAPSEQPTLKRAVGTETAYKVLELLVLITNDRWWSRAWIFQEEHISGINMHLLIRRRRGLSTKHAQKELGDVAGELFINAVHFRKYVTLFYLAICKHEDLHCACKQVLKRATKYSILYKHGQSGTYGKLDKPMSPYIFADVGNRGITVPSDLLAIAANCCEYSIRLNVTKIGKSDASLALSILALYLLNGEIITNNEDQSTLSQNVFQFLKTRAMIIAPPGPYKLTFMKHCRLAKPVLSLQGIHTKGMLWRVYSVIKPDDLPRPSASQKALQHDDHDEYVRLRLKSILPYLWKERHNKLAYDLRIHLNEEAKIEDSDDELLSGDCMDKMAVGIVDAMDAGKTLQLGCLVSDDPEASKGNRAIFTRDFEALGNSQRAFIFTSWDRTSEKIHDGHKEKRLAKYVSMEVDLDGETEKGIQRLRTKRWVNGLCFFNGECKQEFVFPWPEFLSQFP